MRVESKPAFIICDDNNNALKIEGITLFGHLVTMPAIFVKEEDALEVLYAAETRMNLKGNHVKKISGSISEVMK